MVKSSRIRSGRHVVFDLSCHLVFVTKYRRKVFTKSILEELEKIFSRICEDFEAELLEFNGEHDHVHLLIRYHPKYSISKIVNSLKGVSARLIRKENFPSVQKALWGEHLWSPSYFAGSCGGATLETIKGYIQTQQSSEQ